MGSVDGSFEICMVVWDNVENQGLCSTAGTNQSRDRHKADADADAGIIDLTIARTQEHPAKTKQQFRTSLGASMT